MTGPNAKSSQGDFLASLIPSPGSEEAKAITVRSGMNLCESYASVVRVGPLAKMFTGSSRWASNLCWLTWKSSGINARHLLYRLVPSMPRTDETEFGFWPTATAVTNNAQVRGLTTDNPKRGTTLAGAAKMLPTPTATPYGRNKSPTSGASIRPSLAGIAKLWPTPTANEDAAGTPDGKMQAMLGNHPEVRAAGNGTLSPLWVEWLMGYPIGWTDLEDSETP